MADQRPCDVPHDGGCSVDNPYCNTAPNHVDASLRGGDEPDWPWGRGQFCAGRVFNGVHVLVPNYGWNDQSGFRLGSRQDCDDLIALLQVVRERLP